MRKKVNTGDKIPKKKKANKKRRGSSYDQFKLHDGKQYTGIKIGRRHSWYYDKGEWTERKVTPERWEISYAVTKKRKGKASEGSGAPVGTEYHWYILADQYVKKLNANDYTTVMTGYKLKVAHKRAEKDKWNLSKNAQRKKLIRFLKEFIAELERAPALIMLPSIPEKGAKKKATAKKKRKLAA